VSLIHNERIKLHAAVLNANAGSSVTVGVFAPIAAAFYSVNGTYSLSPQNIVIGE